MLTARNMRYLECLCTCLRAQLGVSGRLCKYHLAGPLTSLLRLKFTRIFTCFVLCKADQTLVKQAWFRDTVGAGGGGGHTPPLLQLAANAISSWCCALVAVRSRSTAHASSGSDSDQGHSSSAEMSRASSGSESEPRPQGTTALSQLCDTCCTRT